MAKPLNPVFTPGSPMLTFGMLCEQHNGFPSESEIYTNPPTGAAAVFSTNFGEREYRTVRLPTQPAMARSDPDRDIHDYAQALKKKFPQATDTMDELKCLEDIHKYFDIHDIWYQGLGFLWEVIMQITCENRCRIQIMNRLIDGWIARNYERFTANPVDLDVYDNVFDDADRESLEWENFRDWDMGMLRTRLNTARLLLEPELKVKREAAEAKRKAKREAERIRLEAEAKRIRVEEEQRAIEQQRLELEKAAAVAAEKAETLRREAAERAEAEEEARRRAASRERSERFDRSQAQHPTATHGPRHPNGSQMHQYSNRDQQGAGYHPQGPVLSWHAAQELRFGPPRLHPYVPPASTFQEGQMLQQNQYSPQDVRRALHEPHQASRRSMSQRNTSDSQQSGPVFVHDSYAFHNEQTAGPSAARGQNMPASHRRGFHSGSSGRGHQKGEQQASYGAETRPHRGQSQNCWSDPSLQVFVAGFQHMNIESLSQIMSECGKVEHVKLGGGSYLHGRPQGTRATDATHAFITFADEESVEKAIERWNGQVLTTPSESCTLKVDYPRYSPKNSQYQANYDSSNQNRRQYSRRSSNASQQQHTRRMNNTSSYHEASGSASQGSASGPGSHHTHNMLHELKVAGAEEWTPRRISESTPSYMRATGLLPPGVPLPPPISHGMGPQTIPGTLHQHIREPSFTDSFGTPVSTSGSAVAVGNENVRPGHGHNMRSIKNTIEPRSGTNLEPLGVRRPNVRGEGLSIKIPGPTAGFKSGGHLDENPLSATSTVASSSTAIIQSEHNSDGSTKHRKKKPSKKKNNNNKGPARSGESSGTGALGATSAMDNDETTGNTSSPLALINETPVSAVPGKRSGKQRFQKKAEAGFTVEDQNPTTSENHAHADLKSITPQLEDSGKDSIQSNVGVDTTDQGSPAIIPEHSSTLHVKKTRALKSKFNSRPGRSTNAPGSMEKGGAAVRSSSAFHDGRSKDKEDTSRSQSASGRFKAGEMSVTATGDVAETSEALVEPPLEKTTLDASGASTEKSNAPKTPEAMIEPPAESAIVHASRASTQKSDPIKTNTPTKRMNHPLVALPLPITKQKSPPKVDVAKTRSTDEPGRSSPSQAITSWAEDVISDTAVKAEQQKAEGSIKRDDSQKQSGSSETASSKKDVSHDVGKATTTKKAGNRSRQNKGKGRATTPVIADAKEEHITHVKTESDGAKVVPAIGNYEETPLTESSIYADSNITSPFEPTTEITMPSGSTQKSAQGLQQNVHQNESISSSAPTTPTRADLKTKQPAVTESLSIFGRKKKNKSKNKKENVAPSNNNKKQAASPDKPKDEPKKALVAAESSKEKQEVEKKMPVTDVGEASKVPLPDTPKPADAGASKGRSFWGLI